MVSYYTIKHIYDGHFIKNELEFPVFCFGLLDKIFTMVMANYQLKKFQEKHDTKAYLIVFDITYLSFLFF